MSMCEDCKMYFCEDCYLDHVTDPDRSYCRPRYEEEPKKIKRTRIKRKQKENKKLKTDYCDFCHREFLEIDLNIGEEPFAEEIYGSGQWCKLCDRCYNESLMDI